MIKTFEEFIKENLEPEAKILANKLKRHINDIVDFIDAKIENKDFDIPNKKGVYNIEFDMNMYGKYTVCLNYNVISKDKYMLNKFDIVDKNGVRVSNEWIDITENDYPWLFAIYGPDGYYGVDEDEDDDY